jgi:hypothetical protein
MLEVFVYQKKYKMYVNLAFEELHDQLKLFNIE